MFFPDKGDISKALQGQIVCVSCPVRQDCTDYRERSDSNFGLWGGKYQLRDEQDD